VNLFEPTMKKIAPLLFLFLLLPPLIINAQTDNSTSFEGLTWYTDIMKANEVSKASNKPLFAFFTGSDWCGWCKKLQREVFSKPGFIKWAKENVVLVELDFPRSKALSPEIAQQNESLKQTFQVRGFPTIWVFFLNKNSGEDKYTIDSLGSLGYPQGATPGKEEVKFLLDANTLLKNRSTK